MSKIQQAIVATAKMYEIRDTAKRLLGNEFLEKLAPYKNCIQQEMKAKGVDEINALLNISKTETYKKSGAVQMMFISAVTELIEPSN